MGRQIHLAIIAAVLLVLWSGPASAQDQAPALLDGVTPQELGAIVQDAGYRAKVGRTDDGFDRIESKTQGLNYKIYLYDCNEDEPRRCITISFVIYLEPNLMPTLELVNDWNQGFRFARAYQDSEKVVALQMEANVGYGVSDKNIGDWVNIWDSLLSDFLQHIKWYE